MQTQQRIIITLSILEATHVAVVIAGSKDASEDAQQLAAALVEGIERVITATAGLALLDAVEVEIGIDSLEVLTDVMILLATQSPGSTRGLDLDVQRGRELASGFMDLFVKAERFGDPPTSKENDALRRTLDSVTGKNSALAVSLDTIAKLLKDA